MEQLVSIWKKIKLDLISHIHKIISMWITGLNVKNTLRVYWKI